MKFTKTRDVKSPNRGTSQSAGIDFYIPNGWNEGYVYKLEPGERILIPSGIKLNVPEGNVLIAFNKSGVATKTGVIVGASVVDEDYQGEVHLSIINTNQPNLDKSGIVNIVPGEKIMQFILLPVNYDLPVEVPIDELYDELTERGEGGFGSTGIK